MSRISPFKLGLFIVVCAGFGAVALIWIGATHVFQSTRTYAAFFDEPVSVAAGAPVKHLGVQIGTVDSVELTARDRLVRVQVKLASDFRPGPEMALAQAQAGITGSAFLALDDTPPKDRRLLQHPPTKEPVLPTAPGGGGIAGAAQAIASKISSLDVEGVLSAWEGVARNMDGILARGGVEQTLENARVASLGLRRIAGPGPAGQASQLEAIVREVQAATRSMRAATASVARQVEAVRPGSAAVIANRIERTAGLGEKTVETLDQNLDASLVLLRENLAQLKEAVVEAQALARSLRNEPGRVLERGAGGSDPFTR